MNLIIRKQTYWTLSIRASQIKIWKGTKNEYNLPQTGNNKDNNEDDNKDDNGSGGESGGSGEGGREGNDDDDPTTTNNNKNTTRMVTISNQSYTF